MRMRKPFRGALRALLLAGLAAGTASAQAGNRHQDECRGDCRPGLYLTVLHNNDGESQLLNAGTGIEDFGGIDRFTTVVRDLRRAAYRKPFGAAVTISSGDNFLAGPEFNASLTRGVPYYDSIALSIVGYDAMTFGNHEFDFGPDVTADFISGFLRRTPFLSANLDFSDEAAFDDLVRRRIVKSSTVVRKLGVPIGIIGATTEDLPFISSPRNVVINEVLPAVQREVDRLTRGGVNIIIVSSHLQGIGEELELASRLRNVDVLIAGGGDELLADEDTLLVPGDEGTAYGPYPLIALDADGNEVPVVTTPGDYKYVGRLGVRFDRCGRVLRIDPDSGLVRVAGGDQPDAVEGDLLQQWFVVDPVAESVAALASNLIATSEVALDARRPGIRVEETNEGNLVADAIFFQAAQNAAAFGVPVPDVALQNGGGIRNNSLIPAGPISELTTFDILPFLNFVAMVPSVPREQFKEILENAVSQVEFVSGRFAQISGFAFSYTPAGTPQELDADGNVVVPGSRVVDVTLSDGTPIVVGGAVVPGPALNVATIDFLATGGDQYPFRGAPFTRLGATYQQALSNYLVDGLGGVITAADYPEGGEGRIVQVP